MTSPGTAAGCACRWHRSRGQAGLDPSSQCSCRPGGCVSPLSWHQNRSSEYISNMESIDMEPGREPVGLSWIASRGPQESRDATVVRTRSPAGTAVPATRKPTSMPQAGSRPTGGSRTRRRPARSPSETRTSSPARRHILPAEYLPSQYSASRCWYPHRSSCSAGPFGGGPWGDQQAPQVYAAKDGAGAGKPAVYALPGLPVRARRNVPVCWVAWAASGVPSMIG